MNELALIFELFSSGSLSTFPFPAPLSLFGIAQSVYLRVAFVVGLCL